jgi:hypothetical protein
MDDRSPADCRRAHYMRFQDPLGIRPSMVEE